MPQLRNEVCRAGLLRSSTKRGDAPVSMTHSRPMRLSILYKELTDTFSHKHRLHPERFAKNFDVDEILSSQLDGEHLLLGVGDYRHIFRVRSTKERKEL